MGCYMKMLRDHELLGNYKVLSQIKIVFAASGINRCHGRDCMVVGFTCNQCLSLLKF